MTVPNMALNRNCQTPRLAGCVRQGRGAVSLGFGRSTIEMAMPRFCSTTVKAWDLIPATKKTLQTLFYDTLKDVYFAEKKIVATLPKMAKAATVPGLKIAFDKHRT